MSTLAAAARMIRTAPDRRTWIYFVQEGANGPIKIGRADDPADRLKTLQQGNPTRLTLRSLWRGFAIEERQLHDEFAHARIAGEWFRPEPQLVALADALNDPFSLKEMRS